MALIELIVLLPIFLFASILVKIKIPDGSIKRKMEKGEWIFAMIGFRSLIVSYRNSSVSETVHNEEVIFLNKK